MGLVTISGLPGSGTSTLSKALAAHTGWVYLNTGQVFRQMAQEAGVSLQQFGERAEAEADIDRQLDKRMVELAAEAASGCVLEGRLMGWMVLRRKVEALKVWVHADIKTRASRVSGRDAQDLNQAMAAINERELSERQRYAQHHDIDLADTSIYDLVLDSDDAGPDELCERVLAGLTASGAMS